MTTIQTRQAALLAIIIVLGVGVIAGNLHQVIIGAVWPYITAFWDTHIGLELWK